jgi:hypothetical protein
MNRIEEEKELEEEEERKDSVPSPDIREVHQILEIRLRISLLVVVAIVVDEVVEGSRSGVHLLGVLLKCDTRFLVERLKSEGRK